MAVRAYSDTAGLSLSLDTSAPTKPHTTASATGTAPASPGGDAPSALRKSLADFVVEDQLGEGSYSTVTRVTDRLPPFKSYALKVLDKAHIRREKKTKYVLIERDTLNQLDGHPGIVRLYWTFQDQHSLCESSRAPAPVRSWA